MGNFGSVLGCIVKVPTALWSQAIPCPCLQSKNSILASYPTVPGKVWQQKSVGFVNKIVLDFKLTQRVDKDIKMTRDANDKVFKLIERTWEYICAWPFFNICLLTENFPLHISLVFFHALSRGKQLAWLSDFPQSSCRLGSIPNVM